MSTVPRRAAALALLAEAVLLAPPVLLVSATFTGAALVGKALAYVPVVDVVLQGAGLLLAPLVVLGLVLAAWGVWHGTRGLAALLLQVPVLAAALVPFLLPATWASHLPGGRWWLLALVGVAVAVLVSVLRAPVPTDRSHRRWWWLSAYALAVAALAGAGTSSRALPYDPTGLLAPTSLAPTSPAPASPDPAGTGPSAGDARPVRVPHPAPQNPGLAANPFNSIHNDAWATDAYGIPGPPGPEGRVDSLFTGGDCATVTVDSRGRLQTLCSTLTRVVAHLVDPRSLTVLDQHVVGTRRPDPTDFSSGGYAILDARDRLLFADSAGGITALATRGDRFVPDGRIDVSGMLQPGERITAVAPAWSGGLWFVGALGTVGLVPEEGPARALTLAGEDIENSVAVAERGVYVVTSAALYLVEAGPDGSPRAAWRTGYDTGERQKPGQTSTASGTTPTVFADGRLVAITDNAEPRMHVLVLDAATGAVTCRQPVFRAGASATENSLVALGDTLVVQNNYGYAPPLTSTMGGHTTEPGLAAVAVDPATGRCALRWQTEAVSVPSLVSKGTLAGEVLLTYTKPRRATGVDAWYLTAVDAATGHVLWSRLAGAGLSRNNHYAAASLTPDGDLVVGTVHGLIVLRAQ